MRLQSSIRLLALRPALAQVVGLWIVACTVLFFPSLSPAFAQPIQKPLPRNAAPIRPANNRNASSPPGAIPAAPDAQQHLSQWMNSHRNLSLTQQQSALEAEPGFRQLNPQEQLRMHNLVTRLNEMRPEQRQLAIARTEAMERLNPGERQQVRGTLAQLGSLPEDRKRAVARAFRQLRDLPEAQRQAYLNSPDVRGHFTDQERGTLVNLLSISPLLPPTPTVAPVH